MDRSSCGMVIDMNEAQVRTIEQMREVLSGTQALEFTLSAEDAGRYGWIEEVLRRIRYRTLPRASRGVVLAYLQRFSGYRRAQVTRLVLRWVGGLGSISSAHLYNCAAALRSWHGASCRTRPVPAPRSGSVFAKPPPPRTAPASSASTACTRAIRTGPRAFTTSTRSIASYISGDIGGTQWHSTC